jgi:hypothetical protein
MTISKADLKNLFNSRGLCQCSPHPSIHTFLTYNVIHATTAIPDKWFPLGMRLVIRDNRKE